MKHLHYLYHRKRIHRYYFMHRSHQLKLAFRLRAMEDFIEMNHGEKENNGFFKRTISKAELARFFYPQDEVEIVHGQYRGFRTFISSVNISQQGAVSIALDGFMMAERNVDNKNTPIRARYMTFHPSAIRLIDPILNYPTKFYMAKLPRPPHDLVRVSKLSSAIIPRPVRYESNSKVVNDLLDSASESNSLVTTPEDVLQSTGSFSPLFVQEQLLFENNVIKQADYDMGDKEARIERFKKKELTLHEKMVHGLVPAEF